MRIGKIAYPSCRNLVLSKQTLKNQKITWFYPKKRNKHDLIKIDNTSIETNGEHREKDIDKYVKFLGFKIDNEDNEQNNKKDLCSCSS